VAPIVPTSEPESFIAGDTVAWTRSFPEYSAADGWALTYYLRGPSTLDVTAQASGSGFAATITAANSAALGAGTYEWIARVSKAGEVYTAARGSFAVRPNLALANAGERVSHAARTLALIEAAIEGRIPAGMENYQVGNRVISKIPMLDLYELRAKYASEVLHERNPNRIDRPVAVTFGRA
jgi:hypothetical protein